MRDAMRVIVALLVLCGICVAAGYMGASRRAATRIAAAGAETARCADAAASQQAALLQLQARFDAQARQLDAVRAVAQMALDARDRLQKRLEREARQREAETRKVGREDPSCAALDRMPVCPALAERLWGAHAGADAAAGH